jgi:hypothetical protein
LSCLALSDITPEARSPVQDRSGCYERPWRTLISGLSIGRS